MSNQSQGTNSQASLNQPGFYGSGPGVYLAGTHIQTGNMAPVWISNPDGTGYWTSAPSGMGTSNPHNPNDPFTKLFNQHDTVLQGANNLDTIHPPQPTVKKDKYKLEAHEALHGYKGFNKQKDGSLKCMEMVYEPGKVYVLDGDPRACAKGFHFCKILADVNAYYPFGNESHVYYHVKGWGGISEGSDKVAVQYIEVLKPVSDEEMFMTKMGPTLEKMDKIQAANPQAVFGGSASLILQGVLKYRHIGDIDVILPYFSEFLGAEMTKDFGDGSGDFAVKMQLQDVTFDLFIIPTATWKWHTLPNGKRYRLNHPMETVNAKMKYLAKGSMKHAKDISQIMDAIVSNKKNNNNHGDIEYVLESLRLWK